MIYMIVVASHHFVDRHVAAQQDASSYVVGADSPSRSKTEFRQSETSCD